MGSKHANVVIRTAVPEDALSISMLFDQVYDGTYPDPLMRDVNLLRSRLTMETHLWIVGDVAGQIIASVAYEINHEHRLAKVFGGAVLPAYRGAGLLESIMVEGQRFLQEKVRVDVIFGMTRTSNPSPQIVTEKLGFKQLGLMPNVHKTDGFETHCLTAFYSPNALASRHGEFLLHPALAELYGLVMEECGLPSLKLATPEDCALSDNPDTCEDTDLEIIDASKYVSYRFQELTASGEFNGHFYPFHQPNIIISSPSRDIELFVFVSNIDQYSAIIAFKTPKACNLSEILKGAVHLLYRRGSRYVEIIIRADNIKTIENTLQSRFLPCAYFPAFQLLKGQRHDFVVFSRTFEIIDFSELKLTGTSDRFLQEYCRLMEKTFLKPQVILS